MEIRIDLSNIFDVMNPAFHFLLTNKSRILVLRGGAGSGKSFSVIQALVFKILYDYDTVTHHFLLLRKTLPSAKKSIIPVLKKVFSDWGIDDNVVTENKTDHTYVFSNGSMISIDSLDNPEKVKSIYGITKILMEEANEFTIDDYRQLDLRLRGDKRINYQLILPFNPVSKTSWLYSEFFLRSDPDVFLHHSTYKDNLYLDDMYIKRLMLLADKDKQFYNIYTLGEWGVIDGLVFPKWSIIKEWPSDIKYFVYGLDFGFTAPTAIARVAVEGDDIFIHEEFYETKNTNTQLIEFITNNLDINGEYYCDTAEPARITEMRHNGINAKKSIKEIKPGIDFMKRYNIHITETSTNLITELSTYKWADSVDGKKDKDIPVDFMNHLIDASRYPIYSKWGKKRTFGIVV